MNAFLHCHHQKIFIAKTTPLMLHFRSQFNIQIVKINRRRDTVRICQTQVQSYPLNVQIKVIIQSSMMQCAVKNFFIEKDVMNNVKEHKERRLTGLKSPAGQTFYIEHGVALYI